MSDTTEPREPRVDPPVGPTPTVCVTITSDGYTEPCTTTTTTVVEVGTPPTLPGTLPATGGGPDIALAASILIIAGAVGAMIGSWVGRP